MSDPPIRRRLDAAQSRIETDRLAAEIEDHAERLIALSKQLREEVERGRASEGRQCER